MAVNEVQGIDVLKKAAEEVVTGNPSDLYLKTKTLQGLIGDLTFDSITVEYPNAVTEIYRYRQGGLTGSIISSITVVYTDDSKEFLQSTERV